MIYLDHNATTPVAPEVFAAMEPYFREEWGNPSSSYRFGSKLKAALETAREQVAELIGASPREIIFTSGGTESDNTALHAMLHADLTKRHFITSAVEHSAVLSFCRGMEAMGCRVTYLPVDRQGLLSLAELEAAITPDTAGVSLMWANNETGVLFPVEEIAALCQSRGLLFHCDAVQAVGKLPIDVRRIPINYLALTGHKLGAPKGIRSHLCPAKVTVHTIHPRGASGTRPPRWNGKRPAYRWPRYRRGACRQKTARLRARSPSIARRLGERAPRRHSRR